MALSSTEAEFVAMVEAAKEGIWITKLLEKIMKHTYFPFTLYCDNSSAIYLSKGSFLHRKTKHMEIRYYFLKNVKDKVLVRYLPSEENLADGLSKPLSGKKVQSFQKKVLTEN